MQYEVRFITCTTQGCIFIDYDPCSLYELEFEPDLLHDKIRTVDKPEFRILASTAAREGQHLLVASKSIKLA